MSRQENENTIVYGIILPIIVVSPLIITAIIALVKVTLK